MRMLKIKWSEKVANKEVTEWIGEKRILLNIVLVEKPIGLKKV